MKLFCFKGKELLLSVQHLFAMFGATVLVPLLTGLDPATALVTAGIGTLVFHFVTKLKVPVFLGSSFAFIPPIAAIVADQGIEYAQGGIFVAGLVYVALAVLIYFVGTSRLKKLLPPLITGPIVILIGISLAGVAIDDANGTNLFLVDSVTQLQPWQTLASWGIALFTMVVVVACMCFFKNALKGFLKLIPILIGLVAGYLLCLVLWLCGFKDVMSFDPIVNAPWLNIPYGGAMDIADKTGGILGGIFTLPAFSLTAIIAIAPIALVTFMEHIGDITTSSTVVGEDFTKDPGLHRTMLGDGIATAIAGFFGGPSNTTYSENTGVLATTKNYNPAIIRTAALWAIAIGLVGKFGGVLQTIPAPVKGGIEIILFGMIAAIGIRSLIDSRIDLSKSRNLIVVALVLIVGIGMTISGGIPVGDVSLSGLFVATVLGVVANAILPSDDSENQPAPAVQADTDPSADEPDPGTTQLATDEPQSV